ncbi:MAG TPA: hypothetical protein VFS21_13190 [Roseiflexaceae bacterium]|nr:hypothetical protein [Roseiflexaceae bacterium]
MILVQLQDQPVLPGTQLLGQIQWNGTDSVARLDVQVLWRTEGRGDADTGVIYSTVFERTGQATFSCDIPLRGPLSYDGHLLRIIWEVKATARLGSRRTVSHVQQFRVVSRAVHCATEGTR